MSATAASAWNRARRILAVRLDGMGDVLMTGPAIRALKRARRDRHVTLLTSAAGAEAARLMPGVDAVMTYDPPWMKATARRSDAAADREMIDRLRGAFDAAVIFTVHSQSPIPAALLAMLADIPLRLAHCRENPYQLLTDWVPEPEPDAPARHEVRRQLDLVATTGAREGDPALRVRVPCEAAGDVAADLARWRIDGHRPWVVMHPGATAPSRRYSVRGFAAVARLLSGRGGWDVVLAGGADDAARLAEIAALAGPRVVRARPEPSVGHLAALLARAPMVIANNSGPAHLAAAVGTPVVSLYALTNLQHAPWRVPGRVLFHDVPCRGCLKSVCPMGHHACLREVPPEAVAAAAHELREELMSGAAPLPDDPADIFAVPAGRMPDIVLS